MHLERMDKLVLKVGRVRKESKGHQVNQDTEDWMVLWAHKDPLVIREKVEEQAHQE